MQSLVQTNDKAMRLSFKDALAHKVEHALAAPPPGPVKDSTISTLLVPSNYAELSAVSLHFSLLHNKELKHSRQTANLAVDIICGNTDKPANVELKVVELKNPVAIPVFAQKTEVKRSPARPLTAPDSKQARLAVEVVKQNEYKHYLANMFQRVDQPVEVREETLRVPSNWNDLTEKELFFTLTNQTELEHSRTSAYRAMDILSGKIVKPEGVTLQEVVLFRPVAQPKPVFQVQTIPVKTKTFQQSPESTQGRAPEEQILLLPKHYKDLSQAGLFYTLTHTPELKHSHDTANLALSFLYGVSSKPEWVKFQTVDLTQAIVPHEMPVVKIDPLDGFIPERELEKRAQIKDRLSAKTDSLQAVPPAIEEVKSDVVQRASDLPAPAAKPVVLTQPKKIETSFHPLQDEESRIKREQHKEYLAEKARVAYNTKPVFKVEAERTVLLPEGYESMNPGELHFALIRNPEFKHTNQQAVVTADMLSGRIGTPENVVFRTLKLENIQLAMDSTLPFKPLKETKLATQTEPVLLTRAQLPTGEGSRTLLLPENFESMTETQLHFALSHNREYGHSYESTYETIDIVFGRTPCPDGTTFKTVLVEDPISRAY